MCALDNLDGVRFEVPNVGMDVADPTAEVRKLVAAPAADGNDGLQRAKNIWGLTCDVSARLRHAGQQPGRAATRRTRASRSGCSSRPRCSAPASARSS